MIEIIKNILSKLGLFHIVRKIFNNLLISIRSYFFRKNALKTFSRISKILKEENIEFFLVFGTLLGAIREKKFIKHDLDIDFGVWDSCDFFKLQKIMEKNKFKLVSQIYLSSNKSIEYQNFKDEVTGVSIDFYKFTKKSNEIKYYDFLRDEKLSYGETIKKYGGLFVYCYHLPNYELTEIDFLGFKCKTFKEYNNFLKRCYGNNYMTPIKNYNYREITLKQEHIAGVVGIKEKVGSGF